MEFRRYAPFTRARCCLSSVDQQATSSAQASQNINQLNFSRQFLALAYAESGSTAIAVQKASQTNKNSEEADSNTSNNINIEDSLYGHYVSDECCDDINQRASSIVGQNQHIDQDNVSIQELALIKSRYPGNREKLVQFSQQLNKNSQDACAKAINFEKVREEINMPMYTESENENFENDELYPSMKYGQNKPSESDIKLSLSVKQGDREMIVESDGRGNVVYDEKEVGAPKSLKDSAFYENCSVKIAFILEGQSYQITADENDNFFINGQKVELTA